MRQDLALSNCTAYHMVRIVLFLLGLVISVGCAAPVSAGMPPLPDTLAAGPPALALSKTSASDPEVPAAPTLAPAIRVPRRYPKSGPYCEALESCRGHL